MAVLVKYANSVSTKDPKSDDESTGKGKKSSGMKGQEYDPTSQGGNSKHRADGNLDFVANTGARNNNQRHKGWPARSRGSKFDLEAIMNQPCPKHGTCERPLGHLWKDCVIMRQFRDSHLFQYSHGPNGSLGSGPHCPGHGGGSSNSGFQGQGNQGGYNQQNNQGNEQSGYQSNLKQLNSGQYHVCTMILCKWDQKLNKRAVNTVEPAVPRYLRWTEQPILWSREDHPPWVDNPGHLALVVAP